MVAVFIPLKPKLIQPFLLTWKCRRDELFMFLKSILPNMCKNKLGFPPKMGCELETEALPAEITGRRPPVPRRSRCLGDSRCGDGVSRRAKATGELCCGSPVLGRAVGTKWTWSGGRTRFQDPQVCPVVSSPSPCQHPTFPVCKTSVLDQTMA